jgi:hypothetical protein
MDPDEISEGSRMEGNSIYDCNWYHVRIVRSAPIYSLFLKCCPCAWHAGSNCGTALVLTSRLSSVRRTATPASTFPTVSEISMLSRVFGRSQVYVRVARREILGYYGKVKEVKLELLKG